MQLNSVVLPAPLGPIRPQIAPGATLSVTSSRAVTPPKRIETRSTERSAEPQRSASAVSALASAGSMDFPFPSNRRSRTDPCRLTSTFPAKLSPALLGPRAALGSRIVAAGLVFDAARRPRSATSATAAERSARNSLLRRKIPCIFPARRKKIPCSPAQGELPQDPKIKGLFGADFPERGRIPCKFAARREFCRRIGRNGRGSPAPRSGRNDAHLSTGYSARLRRIRRSSVSRLQERQHAGLVNLVADREIVIARGDVERLRVGHHRREPGRVARHDIARPDRDQRRRGDARD